MYDRNGLKLAASHGDTLNSYYKTSVDTYAKSYKALAYATRTKGNNQWAMFEIGGYDDPRDAAYAASIFEAEYSRETVRSLVSDGGFKEVAIEFRKKLEIPEWKYPAEGLLIEDILGENSYKTNHVSDARAALLEIIKLKKLPAPNLKKAKEMIDAVQAEYEKGVTYREAARMVMGIA
jgi:hypothetical protein